MISLFSRIINQKSVIIPRLPALQITLSLPCRSLQQRASESPRFQPHVPLAVLRLPAHPLPVHRLRVLLACGRLRLGCPWLSVPAHRPGYVADRMESWLWAARCFVAGFLLMIMRVLCNFDVLLPFFVNGNDDIVKFHAIK